MSFYGVLHPSWLSMLLYVIICTQITIASVTIFLHRNQTHRSIDLHPAVRHFFRFWLWHRTGMLTKAWVAIHRKHHAYSDKTQDPHSPQIFGLKTVFFKGAELYRRGAKDSALLERYAKDIPHDMIEQKLYTPHSALGIYALLIIEIILFGVPGITIWAIQMLWIPLFAAGVINGVGHYWGYRNFDSADHSKNISFLGFFIGGEELHNNHHAYPTSAKFSIKPWEVDLGWLYIRIMKAVGLARVKHIAPRVQPKKTKTIDLKTLSDILYNHLQVKNYYIHNVLLPAYKEAAKTKSNETLSIINEYKDKLFVLLNNKNKPEELLENFKTWCHEVEHKKIQTLIHFANYLKSYSLVFKHVT